jgi:hypothetical protein
MEAILSELAEYKRRIRVEYARLVTAEEFENKCTASALDKVATYMDACDYLPEEGPLQLLFDYEAMTEPLRRR